MIKTDMRAWSKAFDAYCAVRKTARRDIIHEKARDFAFKAFKSLPATESARIEADMRKDNLLLKLTVKRLQAKGIQLKGLPSVKLTKARRASGKRALSGVDKVIKAYAKKLLSSKKRSRGYHRVSFLLLAQQLGRSGGNAQVNPRSRLAKTNVKEAHTPLKDTYTLNAVARGMDCPSTWQARDKALQLIKADMEAFTAKRLADARKRSGFR